MAGDLLDRVGVYKRLLLVELISLGVFLLSKNKFHAKILHDVGFFYMKHAFSEFIRNLQKLLIQWCQFLHLGDLLHAKLRMLLLSVCVEIL